MVAYDLAKHAKHLSGLPMFEGDSTAIMKAMRKGNVPEEDAPRNVTQPAVMYSGALDTQVEPMGSQMGKPKALGLIYR